MPSQDCEMAQEAVPEWQKETKTELKAEARAKLESEQKVDLGCGKLSRFINSLWSKLTVHSPGTQQGSTHNWLI